MLGVPGGSRREDSLPYGTARSQRKLEILHK